jgi:membrane-bound ClpP family serine protease
MKSNDGQVVVALAVVAALLILGLGLIVISYLVPSAANVAWGGVSTVIGALATALNAPSGIAAAISEIRKPPDGTTAATVSTTTATTTAETASA